RHVHGGECPWIYAVTSSGTGAPAGRCLTRGRERAENGALRFRWDLASAHRAGHTLRGNFELMISMPKRMTGLLSGSGLLAATLLTIGGSGAAVATAANVAPMPMAQLLSNHAF